MNTCPTHGHVLVNSHTRDGYRECPECGEQFPVLVHEIQKWRALSLLSLNQPNRNQHIYTGECFRDKVGNEYPLYPSIAISAVARKHPDEAMQLSCGTIKITEVTDKDVKGDLNLTPTDMGRLGQALLSAGLKPVLSGQGELKDGLIMNYQATCFFLTDDPA